MNSVTKREIEQLRAIDSKRDAELEQIAEALKKLKTAIKFRERELRTYRSSPRK
jgi:hypothetical protein